MEFCFGEVNAEVIKRQRFYADRIACGDLYYRVAFGDFDACPLKGKRARQIGGLQGSSSSVGPVLPIVYRGLGRCKLPTFVGGTVGQTTYMESLRDYYGDINKMRTCPSAGKIVPRDWTNWDNSNNIPGQTFKAWYINTSESGWMADDDWGVGSYGENSWIRKTAGTPETWGSFANMKRVSEVPLLLDARWNNAWATDELPPQAATEPEQYNINVWRTMATFATKRHGNGLCAIMADMSAIPIDAEELWEFKWHRDFVKTNAEDIDLSWLKW